MRRPAPCIGMRHVALYVREFAACEHFYLDLLGMRENGVRIRTISISAQDQTTLPCTEPQRTLCRTRPASAWTI